MQNRTLEALVWVLVYGGLLLLCLGLFVRRQGGGFGGLMIAGGAILAAAGAFLVWLRSRRR